MASEKTILYFGPGRSASSAFVSRFAEENSLEVESVERTDEVRAVLNRTYPGSVLLDGDSGSEEIVDLLSSIKGDSFTGIVPVVVLISDENAASAAEFLAAGADEVLRSGASERERLLRLEQVLHRADRDVSVHPTTRLPGTNHIARDMQSRLEAGGVFGVCYADLDHFKEFNDRYGYSFGDGVIRILSRILRDMVRGLAPGGLRGAHRR